MKIMCFTSGEVSKIMEIAQAYDGVMANLPKGVKVLGRWGLGGPLPGYPLGTFAALTLVDAETSEALTDFMLPVCLAGACTFPIPVMDMPSETATKVESAKG
jgi:hypothetical protein